MVVIYPVKIINVTQLFLFNFYKVWCIVSMEKCVSVLMTGPTNMCILIMHFWQQIFYVMKYVNAWWEFGYHFHNLKFSY